LIISHLKTFILVKTRKTAGSSVELALSPYLGPGDLATPLRPEEEEMRTVAAGVRIAKPLFLTRYGYPWQIKSHSPLWHAHDYLRPSHCSYRVISLCRNPWDKTVSHFFWSCREQGVKSLPFDQQRHLFQEYVRRKGPRRWPSRMVGRIPPKALDGNYSLYQHQGRPRVDFVLRFESLAQDLHALGDWLGLSPGPSLDGLAAKAGVRPQNRRHWTDFYDPGTRQLVETWSRGEINFYGYDFRGSQPVRGGLL
jgi:hypothetical protein